MSHVDEEKISRHLAAANSKHVHAAKLDVMAALSAHENLKSDIELFPDGTNHQTFKIYGAISIKRSRTVYNIRISIYLYDSHPYHAPRCYVVPTDSMIIKVNQNVNERGRIFLPYLAGWKFPGSNLHGLIQILKETFQEQSPVSYRPTPVPPPLPRHWSLTTLTHFDKLVSKHLETNVLKEEEFNSKLKSRSHEDQAPVPPPLPRQAATRSHNANASVPPPLPPHARPRVPEENRVHHEHVCRIMEHKENFASDFLTRFKPRKVLGRGSFGCVFEAQNLMDEWTYAVKRIHLRGSSDAVNDALKEVRTLASFKHEGIVGYNSSWIEKPPQGWQKQVDSVLFKKLGYEETFDYKNDSVFIYIQMELCTGTLDDWLENNQSRDIKQAKLWFKQLVSAIGYLHQKNKIHRDLKPSNILFDENGRLKICDLGFIADRALSNGREIEIKRTIAGTRMYMAPEQYVGNYTSKVDVFSLGLIFTELCVRMSLNQAIEVFMNYQGGRPTTILRHLPGVEKMVSLMTSADPRKRPTCEEILSHDLLAYC